MDLKEYDRWTIDNMMVGAQCTLHRITQRQCQHTQEDRTNLNHVRNFTLSQPTKISRLEYLKALKQLFQSTDLF